MNHYWSAHKAIVLYASISSGQSMKHYSFASTFSIEATFTFGKKGGEVLQLRTFTTDWLTCYFVSPPSIQLLFVLLQANNSPHHSYKEYLYQ